MNLGLGKMQLTYVSVSLGQRVGKQKVAPRDIEIEAPARTEVLGSTFKGIALDCIQVQLFRQINLSK